MAYSKIVLPTLLNNHWLSQLALCIGLRNLDDWQNCNVSYFGWFTDKLVNEGMGRSEWMEVLTFHKIKTKIDREINYISRWVFLSFFLYLKFPFGCSMVEFPNLIFITWGFYSHKMAFDYDHKWLLVWSEKCNMLVILHWSVVVKVRRTEVSTENYPKVTRYNVIFLYW